MEHLFESGISIPRRDHNKHALIGHFRAMNRGKWQDIEWKKGDVGEFSKTFIDRHKLLSVYIRFKGMKSVKAIPAIMFRRFFEPTSDAQIDDKKWANADKGGTKVKKIVNPEPDKNKDDVKENIEMSVEIVESLILEEARYTISKVGGNFELRKFFGDNTKNYMIVARNADVKVLQARLKAIREKSKKTI